MVRKSLDEVSKFHQELLATRNTRLRKELLKQKQRLKEIDAEIVQIGKRN